MSSISKEELCQKLRIDEFILKRYQGFFGLPEDQVHYSQDFVYHITKLHDQVSSGLSLDDIYHLSFVANKYADKVEGLVAFAELLPQKHLKEMIDYQANLISELNSKNQELFAYIQTLEESLSVTQQDLARLQQLEACLPEYQEAYNKLEELVETKNTQNEALLERIAQNELEYERSRQANLLQREQISDLKTKVSALEAELGSYTNLEDGSAINYQTLLRKKEREIALKYQREIIDLKKQVDLVVEQKEQEWFKKKSGVNY